MAKSNRNLLVLFNTELLDDRSIRHEQKLLAEILLILDSPEHFCRAHELVDRNRISADTRKIIKESGPLRLRPFRFLINKN